MAPSSISSAESEARSDIFPGIGRAWNCPRSTRNPRMLRASSPPALAQTTATSALLPLVAQRLCPVSLHEVPSGRARVCNEAGSLPDSGSVRAKHPSASPLRKRGSHLAFCSGEPRAWMGHITSDVCTLAQERKPESARSISCIIRPYAIGPRWMEAPKAPICASAETAASGISPFSKAPAARGRSLSSVTRAAASRKERSEALKSDEASSGSSSA